jgi:glutamate/tyrosine decarboxylase-like PLP-dependent enzyme
MDPYAEIGPMCRERGAWLHVDGAFGLWARVSPELAGSIRGVELADSWATDAHKMLNTPYDAGFGIVRDPAAHVGAMDISATYLVQAEGARDPSRFVPELSRRARGTPIYATIRALGREGVREMIEGCVQTSQWRGRTVMRFSVSDRATTPADIERAAAAVLQAYDEETRA